MQFIKGTINSADALTKPLGWVLHNRHVRRLLGHFPWFLISSSFVFLLWSPHSTYHRSGECVVRRISVHHMNPTLYVWTLRYIPMIHTFTVHTYMVWPIRSISPYVHDTTHMIDSTIRTWHDSHDWFVQTYTIRLRRLTISYDSYDTITHDTNHTIRICIPDYFHSSMFLNKRFISLSILASSLHYFR